MKQIFLLSGLSLAFMFTVAPLGAGAAGSKVAAMRVASGFNEQSRVPKQYTADGSDVSPPLTWTGVPANAQSLAVYVEDPDAPRGVWWHWILFNIPATTKNLGQGVAKTGTLSDGSMQGTNDFGKIGWNGPAPPPGKMHHYVFHVLALDKKLTAQPGMKKNDFLAAIQGHVIAHGTLTGTYQR